MEIISLENARVFAEENTFEPRRVECRGGHIHLPRQEERPPEDAVRLDLSGKYLVPGFIDAHTHGGSGTDVNTADPGGLNRTARFFASQGTTAWCASISTDSEEQTLSAIRSIREAMTLTGGARLLGIHLEGPFLSPLHKGAMPARHLRAGDPALFRRYKDAAGGALVSMTVAPEVPGVMDLIESASAELVIAAGHSAADYRTAVESFERGVSCITHTFNAMRPFHHREPGIAGAALESDVPCEAILDGRHLHPAAVRLLLKIKGSQRLLAVTDSMMAAGMPDGTYTLGPNRVTVSGGDAFLPGTQTRAGSTLTMLQAFHNLMWFTGEKPETLLPVFTSTPAGVLRISASKGRIAEGKDADLLVFDDHWTLEKTFVEGHLCFQR